MKSIKITAAEAAEAALADAYAARAAEAAACNVYVAADAQLTHI